MADYVKLDMRGLDRVLREEPQKAERWLDGVAEEIVSDIKLSFGTSPGGRSYTRGSVTHVASQPNYPPNVDTGALRASIRWENTGHFERTIMDGVEYGIYLEDGAENMQPRPFVGPVFHDWRGKIALDAKKNLDIE